MQIMMKLMKNEHQQKHETAENDDNAEYDDKKIMMK